MPVKLKHINLFLSLILAVSLLYLASCEKPKTYSKIPEIKFLDLDLIKAQDTLGNDIKRLTVHFSFVDGDGDLGLEPNDTLGSFASGQEDYHNLLFDFYELNNGTTVKRNDISNLKFRFKNISKEQTSNKVLKGEMKVNIDLNATISFADTSFLEFYIKDRSVNTSNIERTSQIYFNE